MARQGQCTSIVMMFLASCLFVSVAAGLSTPVLADDEKKNDVPPPAPNAPGAADPRRLQNILDKFLPPKKNAPRLRNGRSVGTSENDHSGSSRDPVESRAPRDPKVELLLKAAETALKEKNLKVAVDLYQRLLDQPDETLHQLPNGRWQGIRQTVNQKIARLPETAIAEYRSKYSGLARQQLAAAQRSGQTTDFVQVATRFFHTTAGYEAAQTLASRHFDRSEFGMAARWFADLASSSAEFVRQDTWLLQAALALSKAGQQREAEALLERLSNGTLTEFLLGTKLVIASEWLRQMQSEISVPVLSLADWTQIYGTAAHLGTAIGGDAFLSPNWSLPLTSSPNVSHFVKGIVGDLQDQQRPMILAAQPLVIDGKVVYRDLGGLRNVDIETGQVLWEGVEGVSPERILGGLPSQTVDPQDTWRFQNNSTPNLGDYQGQSAEYSPLTSLLFRDGTYGLISSDGNQVFVIEDHGILSAGSPGGERWGWEGNSDPRDLFGVPWKTNRLVSYDLKTGRVLWSVGGSESRETFDPPLAGCYFYGTPAVNSDELYLVAGKGDDLRLWSLDRRSGTPNWSQLIAYSDTKINLDIARRWITSQVAVGEGVIVCPTTVGWLVAIDQTRQSVLWAYRYAPLAAQEKTEREAGTMLLPQKELNAQWCPSAPIVSENRVIFTPQDEELLICLNAADGQMIWEKPKGTGIYLAGVFAQNVVIVGETGVAALHLENGEIAWSTKFEEGTRVSGRGIVVGDHYYLPLSNGGLQTIDLKAGQVLSQTYVGSRQPPLGNLAMHHGKLVSLGPIGLTAYGQCDAVLTEIQQRLAANPYDGGALLRSSEIQLLNRKYSESLSLLHQIPLERLTPAEKERHHTALIECLSTLIHGDIQHGESELEELGRVATSTADRLLHRELTAEKLLAEQKPVEAFDVLCQLGLQGGDAFVLRDDDRHVSVKRAVWLSGRMSEIWSATSETDRKAIDERVKSLIAEASDRDSGNYPRLVSLFKFHPESVVAQERLVERLVQSDDLGGARIVLQQLFDSPNKSIAARATERLARMMTEHKLTNDAVYYYWLLESKFADVIVRNGQTGATVAASARAMSQRDFEPRPKGVLWKASPLRLEHSALNYTPPPQDVVCETSLPFFNRLSFESYANEQRLSMESTETGQVEWMIPLRGAARVNDDGFLSMSLIGHQIFFIHRNTLHAVSPIEKRILWAKTIEETIDTNLHLRHDARSAVMTMVSPHNDESSTSLLLQQAFSAGQLAIVQPNYLCLQGRRSLTVLDPRTGDELWKIDGLPTYSQVVGNRDALFVIAPGKNEVQAYRATDGKPLEIPNLTRLLNDALLIQGSSLLLFEQGGLNPSGAPVTKRARNSKCSLRLFDPVARTSSWQREFPAGTVASTLGQNEVVVVQPDWQIRRIDVETGHASSLEAPFAEAIPSSKSGLFLEKYLLADDDRIYLVVNRMDSDRNTSPEGLASIRVNGWIFAWDRQDNRYLWHNAMNNQNLVVDRFAKTPLLLFVSRSWRHRGRMNMNIGSLVVAAVHKQSGQTLINTKMPAAYSAFHAMGVNAEDHSIELKSYNVRLRLVPTNESLPPEIKAPVLDPTNP